MKINTKFVNTSIKDYFIKISWRKTMNYAAALDDDNPYYFDDERKEGIVAPPMYAVAITWPIAEDLPNYIQSNKFPLKVMKTLVHYTEHLTFNRLIKPNDELTIKGRIAAILPHRSGTHIISRLDAFDKNNALIFTEHIGGMLRGVKCVGEGRGEETLPKMPTHQSDNKPLWKETIKIERLRAHIYDGCADIHFPIHTSKKFAHFVGLPDTILQGTATLAHAIKTILNKEADRDPHRVKSISCKFTGMVLLDTSIEVQLNKKINGEKGTDLFFEVYNNENKKAISHGHVMIESNS